MSEIATEEVRRLLVAFHDVSTWCDQLRARTYRLIEMADEGRSPTEADLEDARAMLASAGRHLEAEREAVQHIRRRVGLPAPGPDPSGE